MFGKKPLEASATPAAPAATTAAPNPSVPFIPEGEHELYRYLDSKLETADYRAAKQALLADMVDQIDFQALERMDVDVRRRKVREASEKLLPNVPIPLTAPQISLIKDQAMDEILGFGPIEPLLKDADVNDIMINTHKRIYIERHGKIFLTDITFLSEEHLLGVIQRIVSRVGRRVDEANPMVDARMPDGSRFNAIIPPLALDGALVSIRKFKKNKLSLEQYVDYGSLSPAMAKFLAICGRVRMNIIISGGTGSGKTTLLNALSAHIEATERVITIEDAAELQLVQPHVLRLETRPASIEGKGEVNQRQLVRNALRMRPDRIILGEMRGDEAIDVLSAMNTGHDGSMATIHANTPRDCLSRIENLVAMSSVSIGVSSLRYQIASALNLIVQIQRMRDGKRRIVQIEEVTGFDSQTIQSQTLFQYRVKGVRADGTLDGEYEAMPFKPRMAEQAEYYGLVDELMSCFPRPV
ncbi:MAG: CpaF family protein [Alphaproteobacteria bacterium]|nr:CpaF family protein [Alphaproteobacteria bacterium]